jgi:hypothetical protein
MEVELETAVLGGTDGCADLRLELSRAGDEVVVDVGLERSHDTHAQRVPPLQVLVDVADRVDGDRFPCLRIGDQEGRVAQLGRSEEVDLGLRRVHHSSE